MQVQGLYSCHGAREVRQLPADGCGQHALDVVPVMLSACLGVVWSVCSTGATK